MDTPGYGPQEFALVTLRPGARGLVLAVAEDLLPPEAAQILENARVDQFGRLRLRPGGTLVFSLPSAGPGHSLGRLYLPSSGTYIAFVGSGSVLWRGPNPAAMAAVSTVLSGNPLTLLPYRPALSGDPWMIISDTTVLGQVPPSGEAMLLGLPAPATAATSRIVDILTTKICDFHGAVSQASVWTKTAGQDDSTPTALASGTPTAADITGLQGNAVEFTTAVGNAAKGYTSVLGLPITADLTTLQGGFRASEPDDIIHMFMRVSRPGIVEEVRVYLVCASGFSPSIVPGQHDALNSDAFVHTFRPSDITGFVEAQQSGLDAASRTQYTQVIDEYLRLPDQSDDGKRNTGSPNDRSGRVTSRRSRVPDEMAPGRNVWTEFGTLGKPLRRSDFERIGSTSGRGWDTITGIIIVIKTTTNQVVKVACDDWYLTGGYGLDSSEPGAQPYDYRYTHYHLDTGDEGNPSPIQTSAQELYPMRQRTAIQPPGPYTGAGNARVRQRFYRRGGTITDDWYYVGQNTANGAEFVDTQSDLDISAAPTVEIDNYQPVPSVDAAGNTALAVVLPAVWGPLDGAIYGCGDLLRPGHLYRSKTGKPGSWPPDLVVEACSPSEELMHGFVHSGQGFVFSRRRLFLISPNMVTGGAVAVQDTPCQKGLAGRWAHALGPDGCVFVSDDGIYETSGGSPAKELSDDIRPLWFGQSFLGAVAINLGAESKLRLFLGRGLIYFQYLGVDGNLHQLVCSRNGGRTVWSRDVLPIAPGAIYIDPENPELPPYMASGDGGAVVVRSFDGRSDDGASYSLNYVSPELVFDRTREEKQLGDLVVETDGLGTTGMTVAVTLDNVTVLPNQTVTGSEQGQRRHLLTPSPGVERRFRAARVQVVLPSDTTGNAPVLKQIQLTALPLVEETERRIAAWEPLGKAGAYLTGVAMTCDTRQNVLARGDNTFGADTKRVRVEYSRGGGATQTLGPFTIDASQGRRTIFLSWAGVIADQVRIVPEDANPWLLYALNWQAVEEPPSQGTWDSGDEILGDTYYTGLDLVVRGEGTALIYVDGALVSSYDFTTSSSAPSHVLFSTRKTYLHHTFGPGYGHIYRCLITGVGGGVQVYAHKWMTEPVPGEQSNWNRNFELAGTLTEKLVKGVLLECDTGGVAKTVEVQADGVTVRTLSVAASGRQVLHLSFAQFRARVLRLLPTDTTLSRLWTVQWIFDEEPLALDRWETQLLDHQQADYHSIFRMIVDYRATEAVTLTIEGYAREGLRIFEDTYYLPDTPERVKRLISLRSRLAILWKYTFTSTSPFNLYRSGCSLALLPLSGGERKDLPAPFGDDDLDHMRSLGSASGIASTPNNGGFGA
jgi:hypothetical protein